VNALERVTEALEHEGLTVRWHGKDQCMAGCPSHPDNNPSLSLRQIRGRALVYCHGGCQTEQVLASLNLTVADLFDDERGVDYRYDNGRVVHRSPTKQFKQSVPQAATSTLYVPEGLSLPAAVEAGWDIFLPEGEQDVDMLASLHIPAVTSPMGARNWDKCDYSPLSEAKRIVIVQDKDEAGAERAIGLYRHLREVTKAEVHIVEAVEGKDVTDHFMSGHTVEELVHLTPPDLDDWDPGLEPEWVGANVPITPLSWAWRNTIPMGGLTLLVGTGGIGKTTFATWLLGQFQQGRLPGKLFGQKNNVMMIGEEDSWASTIVPRFIANGGEPTDSFRKFQMPLALQKVGRTVPRLPTDIQIIERAIRKWDVKVVFIDPILSLMEGNLSASSPEDVRKALDPLNEMANRTGVTVIAVAHMNKNTGGTASTRLSGAHAWRDAARGVLLFAKDQDADVVIISADKHNLSRDGGGNNHYRVHNHRLTTSIPNDDGELFVDVPVVQWLGPTTRTVDDVLADEAANGRNGELKNEILDYIRNAPSVVTIKEIGEEMDDRLGVTYANVKMAVGRLVKAGRIKKFARGQYGPVPLTDPAKPAQQGERAALCIVCGFPLHAAMVAQGVSTHPTCG
jgi:hypothetical protein